MNTKKSLLLSVKPKYVADILKGKMTIEIRKTMPKCDLPIDVYIYCTKDKEFCFHDIFADKGGYKPLYYLGNREHDSWSEKLNGKVVAKFTLRKVEELEAYYDELYQEYVFDNENICEKSCLTEEELGNYLKIYNNNDYQKVGYAWHIEDLVIFDKPKELSEFYHYVKYNKEMARLNKQDWDFCHLTKAPQSYCFIEVNE